MFLLRRMSRKGKGISVERELFHMFWNNGWAASRVAGSGNTKYPSVDVLAGKEGRKIVVECKSSKNKYLYLEKEEIEQVKEFGRLYGGEPWLSVKFNNMGWFFFDLSVLEEVNGSYSFNLDICRERGLSFDDMVSKW